MTQVVSYHHLQGQMGKDIYCPWKAKQKPVSEEELEFKCTVTSMLKKRETSKLLYKKKNNLKWLFLFTFIRASHSPHFLNDTSFQRWGSRRNKNLKEERTHTRRICRSYAISWSLVLAFFSNSFRKYLLHAFVLSAFLSSVQFISQIIGLYILTLTKHHHSPGTLLNT